MSSGPIEARRIAGNWILVNLVSRAYRERRAGIALRAGLPPPQDDV